MPTTRIRTTMIAMRPPHLLLALALLTTPAIAQHPTLLWPNGNPEPTHLTGPEFDPTTDKDRMVSGKTAVRITNVTHPTLTVYSPDPAKDTHAAALVFPGGSYIRLSWSVEGTEVCDWLNSLGMTCILVKYRVPEDAHYPANTEDLEDAQQAMRLTRTTRPSGTSTPPTSASSASPREPTSPSSSALIPASRAQTSHPQRSTPARTSRW